MTMTMATSVTASVTTIRLKGKIIQGSSQRYYKLKNSPNDAVDVMSGMKRTMEDVIGDEITPLLYYPFTVDPNKRRDCRTLFTKKFEQATLTSIITNNKKTDKNKNKKRGGGVIVNKKDRRSSFKKTVDSVESKNKRQEENKKLRSQKRDSKHRNRRRRIGSSPVQQKPVQQPPMKKEEVSSPPPSPSPLLIYADDVEKVNVTPTPIVVGIPTNDSYDLRRFTAGQTFTHDQLIEELNSGKKETHCIWHEMPTQPYLVNGTEVGSAKNRYYSIRSDDEAKAYLQFDYEGINLRTNYMDILIVIANQMKHNGKSLFTLFGSDEMKVLNSIKFFRRIAANVNDIELKQLCDHVLDLDMDITI